MLAKLFGLNKKQQSASVAKERLQIIVAHQRSELHPRSSKISSHLLAELKDEIIEVVKKYVALSEENIRDIDLKVEDSSKNSTIEVNIPFN
ncbi:MULTISPECIES: cell division topological specificity factor MinE [Francisella]|uniref:Cell division topological specificity factor n=1 Tax=Francisella opportunistica TaxID=2016517 RepID=A0A345JSV2_9GAMM|nr:MULTISPECIES: cell division topological specificity factor MinE [Francisella]APC92177.1 Cell division topological specificity factor MinE [Francisella sp. MA067296]AXH30398.1 cell division topological specificity factor MinE [Francisella opportunistica]AXH32038.1 cell division topological specificity factor MinE [Francisella opportunistica]AXH33686.1 cell division topological specificity factor MinE [Francisella opportunistica]